MLDVGAVCDPLANACPEDMICDGETRKCALAKFDSIGDACAGSCTARAGFGLTLYCDGGTKKCALTIAVGEACTPPTGNGEEPCSSGSCNPTSKTCPNICSFM